VTASRWSRSVAGIATSRRLRPAFVAAVLGATQLNPLACGQRVLRNDFDDGAEGWQIYDYDGGHSGNVFHPVTWSRSWARDPGQPASLDQVLSDTDGYGFSFVGFDGEVTGKFSMDELDIQLREN
jgi:hypothetical protein